MKKFGFSRKGDDGGDDSSRNALFGSRKKASPAAPSDNPYAQQNASDPYADTQKYANMTPYQKARADLSGGGGAPSPASQNSGPGGYGAPPSSGYGSDRYGSGGGYGSNRYNNAPPPAASTRGPGGYGGFGRPGDNEPDDNRDALFSGAQERQANKSQSAPAGSAYGQPGGTGAQSGTYGGYGEERELTAEEQEEADVQNILAEKRRIQQESASSVGRSLAMAQAANEVGRATLARLGAQGERLHNTEKNLDLAANQNKIAQDRAAELKTLNRSMFAVHVGNPFTSKQRQARADEQILERHRSEREEREATRREGYNAAQRMESNFREINNAGAAARPQARKKDYGKFNLDDEEGADEIEDQIDDGLNELSNQVSMMNMVGRAIGKEVDQQNTQIERMMDKSNKVDDHTRMNRERLARIR